VVPYRYQRRKGDGKVPGVTFGGGLSGRQGDRGLGVSGDSSCADHVIACRMHRAAGLDGIPAGVGFSGTDNILYAPNGTPPTSFDHPHCFPQDNPLRPDLAHERLHAAEPGCAQPRRSS
jgi:hypothetical protein